MAEAGEPREPRRIAAASGNDGPMKVLVAVEPRAYREAIGLTLQALRPQVRVAMCEPDDLLSEVSRLGPQLVIYSWPGADPVPEGVLGRVELRLSDTRQTATVAIGGHRSEVVNVELEDLLTAVDRTESLIGTNRPRGDR